MSNEPQDLNAMLPNVRSLGECESCGATSTRLFERPLLRVPLIATSHNPVLVPTINEMWVSWTAPGGRGGPNGYYLVERAGEVFLVPDERNYDGLCWRCWAGSLSPHEHPFLANLPAEFRLEGWRLPIWLPPSQRAAGVVMPAMAAAILIRTDHIHVEIRPGFVANVDPDVSEATLNALGELADAVKRKWETDDEREQRT